MSMSARQMAMLAPRLTSSDMDRAANKEGQRRTIYFTKKLPGDGGYRRTGQYLGEWQKNKWSGNGTHEMANGNRYVGVLVLATQMVHLVIMGDFFYFYLRSVGRGMPIQLPTAAGMV